MISMFLQISINVFATIAIIIFTIVGTITLVTIIIVTIIIILIFVIILNLRINIAATIINSIIVNCVASLVISVISIYPPPYHHNVIFISVITTVFTDVISILIYFSFLLQYNAIASSVTPDIAFQMAASWKTRVFPSST